MRIPHRDLKAKNVLVNIFKPLNSSGASNLCLMRRPDVSIVLPHTEENYVAKLADFGLANCSIPNRVVQDRGIRSVYAKAPWNVQ